LIQALEGAQSPGAVDRGGDIVGGHIGWKGRDGLRAVRLFFFFSFWQREKWDGTEPVPPIVTSNIA